MKIGINRPNFFPWLGFMALLDHVDIFIVLDTVILSKNNFVARNQLKDPNGNAKWFSARKQKGSQLLVKDALLSEDTQWKPELIHMIENYYRNAPCYSDYAKKIKEIILFNEMKLVDYNTHILKNLSDILGIKLKFVKASDLLNNTYTDAEERVIDLCLAAQGTEYYNPRDGVEKGLYHPENFNRKGLKLFKQIYTHPDYEQIHGSFLPYMSVIDLLFNCGEKSLGIIRRGCDWELQ